MTYFDSDGETRVLETPVFQELAQRGLRVVGAIHVVHREWSIHLQRLRDGLAVEDLPARELTLEQWDGQVEVAVKRRVVELVTRLKVAPRIDAAYQCIEVLGLLRGDDPATSAASSAHLLRLV